MILVFGLKSNFLKVLNMTESQLYVFYTRTIGHDERWTYKYPAGWYMNSTGAIKTTKRTNINDPKLYVQDEYFVGPKNSLERMKKVINEKFKSLKNKGVILRYKIRGKYLP